MKLTLFIFALAFTACSALNDVPIIGVLTIPSNIPGYPAGNYSYIPASYVKLIESAGGRVVPIPYDATAENVTFLLKQVNGVLFIGGTGSLTEFDKKTGGIKANNLSIAAASIFNQILQANTQGEHIPISGTSLGMGALALAISQDLNVVWTNFSNLNVASPVKFVPETSTSKLWSAIPHDLQDYAQNQSAFYFNHNGGIPSSTFLQNPKLNELLKITSVGQAANGPTFVASAEGRNYPIYMNQFNPEYPAFEWKSSVKAPHSAEAIDIAQLMINQFIDEAKKNTRKFADIVVQDSCLIYNWAAIQKGDNFQQVYLFRTVKQDKKTWPGLFK